MGAASSHPAAGANIQPTCSGDARADSFQQRGCFHNFFPRKLSLKACSGSVASRESTSLLNLPTPQQLSPAISGVPFLPSELHPNQHPHPRLGVLYSPEDSATPPSVVPSVHSVSSGSGVALSWGRRVSSARLQSLLTSHGTGSSVSTLAGASFTQGMSHHSSSLHASSLLHHVLIKGIERPKAIAEQDAHMAEASASAGPPPQQPPELSIPDSSQHLSSSTTGPAEQGSSDSSCHNSDRAELSFDTASQPHATAQSCPTMPSQVPQQPAEASNEPVVPFRLIRRVGRGSFGDVYLGEWENVQVAVKVIAGPGVELDSDDHGDMAWSLRKEQMAQLEAMLLSAIAHPHIVTTYQVSASKGPEAEATAAAATAASGSFAVPEGYMSNEPLSPFERSSPSRRLAALHSHQRLWATSPLSFSTSPGRAQQQPSATDAPTVGAAALAAAAELGGSKPWETSQMTTALQARQSVLRRLAPGPPEGSTFQWHMVMEFCDQGSLSTALANQRFHEPEDAMHVRWDAWAVLRCLDEVAEALHFLHHHRIVHGDLKAANVLLSSSNTDRRGYVTKVADFGLSRVLNPGHACVNTGTYGTVTHMPPELIKGGTLSPAADVYAFGIFMWEMYTAERVFEHLSDNQVVLAVVRRGTRPVWPMDAPPGYRALAERCWAQDAAERPMLGAVRAELVSLMATMCPQGDRSPWWRVQAWLSRLRQASYDLDMDAPQTLAA